MKYYCPRIFDSKSARKLGLMKTQKNAGTVLIIDDERKLCSLLARIIGLEGFEVLQAYTGEDGLRLLEKTDVDVILSDVKLPDIHGVELVKLIKQRKPHAEIINLTAFGSIQDGVQAMKNGAFDYIVKGDDNDKIIPLVYKAMEKALSGKSRTELFNGEAAENGFNAITGSSGLIKSAVELARKVALTDTTVLLTGETGTGKEVFARAIHQESRRSKGPFVAVNCSSLGAELLESELFGYKAGAFTGALKNKKGLFEEADKGTIFLDEIGEMDLHLQARLLRVLENQTFIKVGDTQTTSVDVRIIAATNRNLKEETEAGRFREDLFYRLSVFTIELPSLEQRKGDVPILAGHYLDIFTRKTGKDKLTMDSEFIRLMNDHHWKGNIRELKNIMERVVILADGPIITADLLPLGFHEEIKAGPVFDMSTVEKQHIRKVLDYTAGNKTEAARLLGIGLTTLYRKIEEYKL